MNIFQDVICSKNLCEDEKGDKVEVHSIIHHCIYLSILQPEVQSRTQSSRPRTQKNPKTDPLEAQSATSWRNLPGTRQLTPEILMPGISWRASILKPNALNFRTPRFSSRATLFSQNDSRSVNVT